MSELDRKKLTLSTAQDINRELLDEADAKAAKLDAREAEIAARETAVGHHEAAAGSG